MKTPKRRKRPPAKQPRWFIVRRGFVQNYVIDAPGGRHRTCVPLFTDRATCEAFIRGYMDGAKRLDEQHDARYRPAEIGTVEGETLAGVLAAAESDGVHAAIWVQEIRDNAFTYRELQLEGGAT